MRALILTLGLLASPAAAAELYEVKMLNRNETGGMVFEPDYLRLQPGDRVKFLATHATHNAASMAEMLPEGADSFKGQINEEIEITFTEAGFYGIKCIPHYAMGMVMLVQVGDAPAADATIPEDLPEQAAARFRAIIQRAAPDNG